MFQPWILIRGDNAQIFRDAFIQTFASSQTSTPRSPIGTADISALDFNPRQHGVFSTPLKHSAYKAKKLRRNKGVNNFAFYLTRYG
jgi:hypothetical protein